MRYRLWLSVYVAITSDARATERSAAKQAAHTESRWKAVGGVFFLEMLLYLILAYAVCVVASAASAAPALPGPVSSYEPYPKLNPNSAWQLEIRASAKQKKPIEFAAYPCIAGNCTTAGDVAESGAETVVISAATTAAGNAVDLTGCIAVVQRSSSKLITDIHDAQAAGAAAVLIINDGAALPLELSELHIPAHIDAATNSVHEGTAPCLLVPREAAAALTGSAVQVRLVQGGASTPFTESVSRSAPVCYVIHNALQHDEAELIKRKAMPRLRPSYVGTSGQAMRPRYYSKIPSYSVRAHTIITVLVMCINSV
jgi:PA domain